jgi:hypothetical protein
MMKIHLVAMILDVYPRHSPLLFDLIYINLGNPINIFQKGFFFAYDYFIVTPSKCNTLLMIGRSMTNNVTQ